MALYKYAYYYYYYVKEEHSESTNLRQRQIFFYQKSSVIPIGIAVLIRCLSDLSQNVVNALPCRVSHFDKWPMAQIGR